MFVNPLAELAAVLSHQFSRIVPDVKSVIVQTNANVTDASTTTSSAVDLPYLQSTISEIVIFSHSTKYQTILLGFVPGDRICSVLLFGTHKLQTNNGDYLINARLYLEAYDRVPL